MALPVGALTATVTAGASTGLAGSAGAISDLVVAPECRLVWAATGEALETIPDDGTAGSVPILADQPGVLASSTVAGESVMVEVRAWPVVARWTVTIGTEVRRHTRRFAAPASGATVDLDLLPQSGVVAPGTVTYAQTIMAGSAYQAAVLAGYTGTEEEWSAGLAAERMDAIAAADRAEAAANEARGLITSAVRASYDPGTDDEVLTLSIPTGMLDPIDPLILLLPVEVSF